MKWVQQLGLAGPALSKVQQVIHPASLSASDSSETKKVYLRGLFAAEPIPKGSIVAVLPDTSIINATNSARCLTSLMTSCDIGKITQSWKSAPVRLPYTSRDCCVMVAMLALQRHRQRIFTEIISLAQQNISPNPSQPHCAQSLEGFFRRCGEHQPMALATFEDWIATFPKKVPPILEIAQSSEFSSLYAQWMRNELYLAKQGGRAIHPATSRLLTSPNHSKILALPPSTRTEAGIVLTRSGEMEPHSAPTLAPKNRKERRLLQEGAARVTRLEAASKAISASLAKALRDLVPRHLAALQRFAEGSVSVRDDQFPEGFQALQPASLKVLQMLNDDSNMLSLEQDVSWAYFMVRSRSMAIKDSCSSPSIFPILDMINHNRIPNISASFLNEATLKNLINSPLTQSLSKSTMNQWRPGSIVVSACDDIPQGKELCLDYRSWAARRRFYSSTFSITAAAEDGETDSRHYDFPKQILKEQEQPEDAIRGKLPKVGDPALWLWVNGFPPLFEDFDTAASTVWEKQIPKKIDSMLNRYTRGERGAYVPVVPPGIQGLREQRMEVRKNFYQNQARVFPDVPTTKQLQQP